VYQRPVVPTLPLRTSGGEEMYTDPCGCGRSSPATAAAGAAGGVMSAFSILSSVGSGGSWRSLSVPGISLAFFWIAFAAQRAADRLSSDLRERGFA